MYTCEQNVPEELHEDELGVVFVQQTIANIVPLLRTSESGRVRGAKLLALANLIYKTIGVEETIRPSSISYWLRIARTHSDPKQTFAFEAITIGEVLFQEAQFVESTVF